MLQAFSPASVTLASPSGYNFDVQYGGYGSGQLIQGTANAFDGFGRLQVGGTDYAPALAAVNLANNGQSVLLPAQTLAGLTVSRKVTVPSSGNLDFARTRRQLPKHHRQQHHHHGDDPGQPGFRRGHHGLRHLRRHGRGQPQRPVDRHHDDGGGTPAVISYIHGPAGLAPTSVSLIGDNITWTYSLTVPAGQTVSLASFTIQSMSQATAIAEANALTNGGGFCARPPSC